MENRNVGMLKDSYGTLYLIQGFISANSKSKLQLCMCMLLYIFIYPAFLYVFISNIVIVITTFLTQKKFFRDR